MCQVAKTIPEKFWGREEPERPLCERNHRNTQRHCSRFAELSVEPCLINDGKVNSWGFGPETVLELSKDFPFASDTKLAPIHEDEFLSKQANDLQNWVSDQESRRKRSPWSRFLSFFKRLSLSH